MNQDLVTSTNQKRERTLLLSCLLSGWAPFVTGYAALLGQSILLFGDFLRRTSELVGLILAWYTTRKINQCRITDSSQILKREQLSSLIVALIMLLSAIVVGFSSIHRFMDPQETSNIVLGLFVAISGTLVNGWFFLRYAKLNKLHSGPILKSQINLYRAKTILDIGVALILILTKTLPSPYSQYIDPLGSLGLAILLLVSGIKTLIMSRQSN